MTELVSVLIPCFNAERWIGEAIESALAQTYAPVEVVVVDDGSTDGSFEIIKSFRSRIYFETGPNQGGNVARNRLLALSSGSWLQYLDADDYLSVDKIEQQMAFVVSHPDVDIVYSPLTLEHWNPSSKRLEFPQIPSPRDPWILLARWYLPQTGAVLWRKSAIETAGGWKADQPCCQEHELYLRLLMSGATFAYCAALGAVYRQWSDATVCKKDPGEVTRQRIEIVERAEEFLATNSELSARRRWAINQTRFEMARAAWHRSQSEASWIVDRIQRSDRAFRPAEDAAPPSYKVLYRALGFAWAERIADARRSIYSKLW